MNLKDLQAQKVSVELQMGELNDHVASAKRRFNAEEKSKWANMLTDLEDIEANLKIAEKAEDLRMAMATEIVLPETKIAEKTEAMKEKAFRNYLTKRPDELTPEERGQIRELRGTSTQITTTDALGGYLIPESWMQPLMKYLLAFGGMLEVAHVYNTSDGRTLNFQNYDDTANIGAIIAETVADVVLDVAIATKTLGAFTYTSRIIKESYELIQDDMYDLKGHLTEIMGERLGRKLNLDFTVGAGTTLPFGVVTQAADSGQTAGAVTTAVLLAAIHSVDPAYRTNGIFMFNDTILHAIRGLNVTEGWGVWQPSTREGAPGTIYGHGYKVNQQMDGYGAGNKWMLFGDFKKYHIRRVGGITMESSWEAFFGTRSVGFNSYLRADGALIGNVNAIKYVDQAP